MSVVTMPAEELKQYVENSLSVKDVPGSFDALFVPGNYDFLNQWSLIFVKIACFRAPNLWHVTDSGAQSSKI